jgi:hypothetical protein
MRCMSCGAEMRLLETERDDSMGAPGYQRQTLQCSGCNEVERRTIYSGEDSSNPAEPALAAAPSSPSIAPATSMTPVASILSEADEDLDESEAMLRRAIEMVRGLAHGSAGLTHGLAGIARVKKSAPSRVVRIRFDAVQEPGYVAADAQSGLVLLRHQDNARLRAMCDRLGWQVIDADEPVTDR